MPLTCTFINSDYPKGPWMPGWVFWFGYDLSDHYQATERQQRRPLSVVLPTRGGGATPFCVDSHPTDDPRGAWTVEVVLATLVDGQVPDITVRPSIHCVGLWHGYLTHGVLSDDIA